MCAPTSVTSQRGVVDSVIIHILGEVILISVPSERFLCSSTPPRNMILGAVCNAVKGENRIYAASV